MPTSMTLGGNLISSCISSWRTFSGSQSQKASHLGRSRCIFYSTSHTRRHISTSRPTFPCVEAHADRESRLLSANSSSQSNLASRDPSSSGPEPAYARPSPQSYKLYQHQSPLALVYNASLPSFDIAYETWGTLSASKDNAILIHTGLSASSHAASTPLNHDEGWWENFIGPGRALDTNDYYIICTNILGGCYGSTGPSSVDPTSGQRYGTNFPVISIFDMVRAQFCLLDYLGINRLYASVGCSMGGMQSLAAGWLFPDRVRKIVSISGTARTSPSSIAIRFAQRSVLMADPNWNSGFYYEGLPPHTGMKLARRRYSTITYRSGPEWEQRFGRSLRPPDTVDNDTLRTPALCPDFLIETYLDHQGEQFCLKYDANSLIYISKAMDLFDLSQSALAEIGLVSESKTKSPDETFRAEDKPLQKPHPPPANPPRHLDDLADGMQPLSDIPTLVLGVQSDVLFPVDQQREVADALRMIGNREVRYYELGGVWGHDTFLLDVQNVGGAIRGFLS